MARLKEEYVNGTKYFTRYEQETDEETGEVYETQETYKKIYGSSHFYKLYKKDFVNVLEAFENKQMKVFAYILKKMKPSTNYFLGTYRSISKDCDVSLDTVRQVMTKLQERKFIQKVQNGVYFISPYILVQGNDSKKRMLEREFDEAARNAKTEKENPAPADNAGKEDVAPVDDAGKEDAAPADGAGETGD